MEHYWINYEKGFALVLFLFQDWCMKNVIGDLEEFFIDSTVGSSKQLQSSEACEQLEQHLNGHKSHPLP